MTQNSKINALHDDHHGFSFRVQYSSPQNVQKCNEQCKLSASKFIINEKKKKKKIIRRATRQNGVGFKQWYEK